MPTWNAWLDAASTALATSGPTWARSTRASVWVRRASAAAAPGRRERQPGEAAVEGVEANCAETTAPMAATASRPATRAIALLIPEAMPALDSSASASTVAVSGATVADSPTEKTSSAGSRSVT